LKWICKICGFIYEGDEPPEVCPVCKVGKEFFELMAAWTRRWSACSRSVT
jgi:rubrerythrin